MDKNYKIVVLKEKKEYFFEELSEAEWFIEELEGFGKKYELFEINKDEKFVKRTIQKNEEGQDPLEGVEIIKLTNQDKDFYNFVGPFLANRKIAKEMGTPLWDDDEKVWFVAVKDGEGIATCAYTLNKKKDKATLRSSYVKEEYREHGLYHKMFKIRLEALKKLKVKEVVGTATAKSKPIYEQFGFKFDIPKGKYFYMRKEL